MDRETLLMGAGTVAVDQRASQGVTARRLDWLGTVTAVGALIAAGVMASYFFAEHAWSDPSRLGDPPLVIGQLAAPTLGTIAILCFVASFGLRAGRSFRPLFGWLAAVCLILLLASFSASNHAWIMWGEGFEKADVTGIGEPGPLYELPAMLAPVIAVPLFLSLGTLFLVAWIDGLRRRDRGLRSNR